MSHRSVPASVFMRLINYRGEAGAALKRVSMFALPTLVFSDSLLHSKEIGELFLRLFTARGA